MTFHFNITYKTLYGEELALNILIGKDALRLPLSTADGEHWSCQWSVDQAEKSYPYYYRRVL